MPTGDRLLTVKSMVSSEDLVGAYLDLEVARLAAVVVVREWREDCVGEP